MESTKIVVTRRRALMMALALALIGLLALPLAGCGNSIEGNYKVTEGSWGQASPGAAIVFDGGHCNLYSPSDTYSFSDDELTVTGLLGGSFTFKVTFDGDKVELQKGSTLLVLERQGK